LGYGVEFNQPAQIAEGLAQIAVHKNEVAIPMSGTDEAAKAPQGQLGVAMIDLLEEIRNSEVIRNAPCWRDGSYIEDDPLVEAPKELWQTVAKWRVDPSELRERTVMGFQSFSV
jgi:Questin oxidase-like